MNFFSNHSCLWPLLVATAVVLAAPAALTVEDRALPGHVPEAAAHLQPLARKAPAENMDLWLGLRLRNTDAMAVLLQSQYDPANSNYRKWLTPEQFAEQFGPTEEDYQRVIAFAEASGFKVTAKFPSRRLLHVTAAVADVEKAFHVRMQEYQHPTEARRFYAPDTEPTIDSTIPILSVGNINNFIVPHPHIHRQPAGGPGNPQPDGTGTAPDGSGGYFGNDFRKAYLGSYSTQGNVGAGQTIGILEFDQTFNPSDFSTYTSDAGISTIAITIYLDSAATNGYGKDNGEASLDVEVAAAVAPGALIVVFDGQNTDTILDAMANDTSVLQFSASWGYGVDATSDTYFMQMAMQGQSFLNSSGDTDAQPTSRLGIGLSSADPNITVVGGTSLTTDASLNYLSEKVWNDDYQNGTNQPPTGYWGSTGGVTAYPVPSWQTLTLGTLYTNRTIPDVALTAENVWIIDNGGNHGNSGGTSVASPLWAGFIALVNAQAAAAGQPSPGFLNPTLYSLSKGSDPNFSYTAVFHDITSGSNAWLEMPTNYFATTGYDLATGLGSPTSHLVTSLSGTDNTIWVHESGPGNNTGSFASPLGTLTSGVSAVPASGTIVLLNNSASPGPHVLSKAMKITAVGGTSKIGP